MLYLFHDPSTLGAFVFSVGRAVRAPALARRRRVKGVTPTATLRHPASLRPSLHIPVQSFGRFDEILYLVEKISALTLPDFGRCPVRGAIGRDPLRSRLDSPAIPKNKKSGKMTDGRCGTDSNCFTSIPPHSSLYLFAAFSSAFHVRASIGVSSFTRDLCNELSRHKTAVDLFVRCEYRV